MVTEVERLKRELEEKSILAEAANIEVENVKAESTEAMEKVKSHVQRIQEQAEAEKEKADKAKIELTDKIAKLELDRKSEISKLQAVSRKALGDMKQMQEERRQLQAKFSEITEIKAALIKAQGERDLEKVKAEKAEEMMRKMEDVMKDAQEERARNQARITALENRNITMSRKMPCDRTNCDYSCGKDHHCGTPSLKPRRRSKSRNNRQDEAAEEAPTVANLASQAGVPQDKMQNLVNSQARAQVPRLPPRPERVLTSGVDICRNYHYGRVCMRGNLCKYAHRLVPANEMPPGAMAFNQAVSGIQKQAQQAQQPQGRQRSRSMSTGRQFPVPDYNPLHPDYEAIMASRNAAVANNGQSGNAREQTNGAGPALSNQPQQTEPTRPHLEQRPRASSEASASSGVMEARRNIQDSLTQQSSNKERMKALKDKAWKDSLESVMDMVSKSFPRSAEGRTQSRSTSAETSGSSTNLA